MRLQNKVAVLTGGGSGIGRATALRFAEEGARVVVDDLNQAWADETVSLVAKQGGEAVAVIADVTERAGVRKMFGTAQERFGGYDILVNNAGVLSHASILDLEEEEWDRVMRVNLRSMYLCTQEAARYWVQNRRPGKNHKPGLRHVGDGRYRAGPLRDVEGRREAVYQSLRPGAGAP